MNISENVLSAGSSLALQVHAAAVNGDKGALQRLIVGNPALKDKEDQFGRTPLMYCVLADRLDCADALLKAGADVNKTDHSRRTALHLAAQKGNYRFMKLLLTRRANWMQKDLEEMTPLHLTTRHRSPKCLALLLKFMAPGEVDTQDKNKQTALHWSAYYNNPEHAKLLIKHDSNIGIPDIEGKIPLHWAANHKDPSAVHTVRCILDAAPTESLLNWQDYEGRTPLHFAVADGNLTVVDVLTSYESCNITSYDNLFRTPLHWAALLGHAQIVHLLLERNKSGTIPSDSQGATPLHYAAQSNFAETVKVFLKHPSVKDDPDLEGRTSFMWAAGKGSDDVLRTMLSLNSDIDINMADKYGGTALHAAALSGHVSTVKLLLDNDAQVDATDVMKHTPLFRACEMGHKDVIQTLIKGGARVDLVDQDGHSLLHWAALGGNADVCQILIENKINPNVQDYAGRTPLQCAAYGGYINCMAVLMENSADPNIQDKEGRTALHWSCNNGYLDAIKLLLDFAAFPNQMENNEERYTPLDYALLGERHEVIQFMLEHGALSIAAIQDIAAFKIQAVYKGYKVRKAFRDRKNLLMKHEQLRKDAAAKKREEENKRKEAEQQRELQSTDPQPHILPCPPSPQSKASKQSAAPSKQPPAGHTVQGADPEHSRSAGQCPGRAALKDSPSDLQGTASRKPDGTAREHCRGPSACVHLRSREGGDGARHQGASSVEKCRGETNGEHQCEEGPRRARQPLSFGSAQPAEKGEDSSPASASQQDSPRKASRRQDRAPRPRGASQKRRTHQLRDRCSPAGSSRPGSARRDVACTEQSPLHHRTPRNKVAQDKLVGGVSSDLPLHTEELRSGCKKLCEDARASPERDVVHGPPPGQSVNIHLLPVEQRLQIIQRERSRKELFRRKNKAATVIQRAWRSYQLRKHLPRLLHGKQFRAGDMLRCTRVCTTLLLQVWRTEVEHRFPKSVTISRTPKSPSKGMSATKSARHSVLRQIYGCSQEGKVQPTTKPSKGPPVPHLSSVNSLQSIHLDVGRSKKFSYNLQPASQSKNKPKL
uniref:inversin isoform X1 n=2 Tax=Myodes glareolus TaxID=447135 RepID=UPI0020202AE5|nr:inversin isoform X1 [Myodes glareolus]